MGSHILVILDQLSPSMPRFVDHNTSNFENWYQKSQIAIFLVLVFRVPGKLGFLDGCMPSFVNGSDPHPFFTSTRFDDGILPTLHFSILLPSPSSRRRSGSFPTRSGPPQQSSSTPVSCSSHSTLEAHPLSFSPLPSPQFSSSCPHPSPVLASLPIPPPPSHPCLRFLRHCTLLIFSKSQNVLCHVLPELTSPVIMCLCVGLSSFFLLLPLYFKFLLRLGNHHEIQEFSLS